MVGIVQAVNHLDGDWKGSCEVWLPWAFENTLKVHHCTALSKSLLLYSVIQTSSTESALVFGRPPPASRLALNFLVYAESIAASKTKSL